MGEPEISASAGVTGGFGDALTAALDVMAFAHDIDLASATEGIPTTDAASKAKAQQAKVPTSTSTTTNQPNTQVQSCDTNHRIEGQATVKNGIFMVNLSGFLRRTNCDKDIFFFSVDIGQAKETIKPSVNKNHTKDEKLDPLLNLVIASESPDSHKEQLLKIAEEARIASEPKVALDSQVLETFGLGNFMAPGRNPEPETIEKKYMAESSDNDICGSEWCISFFLFILQSVNHSKLNFPNNFFTSKKSIITISLHPPPILG